MAGTLSNAGENLVADYVGTQAVYLAIFITTPTDLEAGTGGTEASGGSYAREAITWAAASGGGIDNSVEIVFEVGVNIAADTYNGWGAFTLASGGTFIMGDSFNTPKTLTGTGDTLTFQTGSISYSVT